MFGEVDVESRPLLHQTLSIAYYNLGVEYEYNKQMQQALESFKKSQYFGTICPLSDSSFIR